jgi:Initiator Replication protein
MEEQRKEATQDVIKHSAAIQIQNNITLLQRRAWNVLLAHAYDDLPTKDIYHIDVPFLMTTLEFNSKNGDYLKDSIESLVGCKVKWNLLDKDGSEIWGVAALLASAEIQRGVCTYGFAPHMRQRLHNPSMYARLCLSLQNKFDSKYALALWELCTDYLGYGREYGETSYIDIDDFRKLMGVEESDFYALFKELKRKIITPAINEINHVSDFHVTVDYKRQGRKITAVKFKIRRVKQLPTAGDKQPDLFPDLQDMPPVVKALKDAGLAVHDAWEIWQQGFDYVERGKQPEQNGVNAEEALLYYVQEKIHLLHQRQQIGKVANPTGFLLTAIKKNYTNAQFAQEQTRKKQQQKTKELRQLTSRKEQLLHDQDAALQEVGQQMVTAIPDLVEQAIAEERHANNAALHFGYERDKTALENYRHHRYVAAIVHQRLEARFPERFAEVRKSFQAQLEAIEMAIGTIEGHPTA